MTVHFFVNNKPIQLETAPDRRLLDILREDLLLTGTKEGCSEGECGACTVLLDNEAVHACLILAIQLEGCHITTIEGLAASGELDALQKAFIDEIAIQCGFCTPGMILSAKALLMRTRTRAEMRSAVRWPGTFAAAPATSRSSAPSTKSLRRGCMKSYNPRSLDEFITLQASLPAQTQILSGGTDWIIAHRRKAEDLPALLWIGGTPI